MKRRGRNPNKNPGVRPVTKIELDEKKNKKRTVWAIVLLVAGLSFLGYALFAALSKDAGWVQIEPVSEATVSVADDMVLLYELGATELSPTAEYKELSTLYTELCIKAYRIFSAQYAFDGVGNVHAINAGVGQAVTVEPALYRALEQVERSGSRVLFTAPFAREYGNLFLAAEDGFAEQYDPRKSEEIATYFAELSAFTASDEHIRLELLGDHKVKLTVSDAYRAFARENGLETFLDFWWTRNAFAVDYIAEELSKKGFIHGSLTSYDGFVRVLDDRGAEYAYRQYAIHEGVVYDAARLVYTESRSMVYFRSFRLYERDDVYYTYRSGERRHPYVDVTDGLCKNATDGLIAYAADRGCAEVLLSVMPVYIADTLDENALSDLKNDGIFSVYAEGTVIRCNDPAARLTDLYNDGTVRFTAALDD